jgi:hypothetical protein
MLCRMQSGGPARGGLVTAARWGRGCLAGALGCALALLGGLAAWGASPALAARLAGGGRQAAIKRAFTAHGAHKQQTVVSVRTSTVNGAWALVESVRLPRAGRTGASAGNLRPTNTYYHVVHGAERSGNPPGPVKADLGRNFKLAVLYTGSGSETINYTERTAGVCQAAGGWIDQQTETVTPMSWSLRYVIDLDSLAAAVSDGRTVVVVPAVTLDRGASTLNATEQTTRSTVDLSCNGTTTTTRCATRYRLGGSGSDNWLSLIPAGLEVGIPMSKSTLGSCDPDSYTLGPSLWDSDAATALAGKLKVLGGSLPANPYAPVKLAWPFGSSLVADGAIASPCQGNAAACTDSMNWKATVRLQPVTGG